MSDIPRQVYLKSENGWPMLLTLNGETSRSWLTGPSWRPRKWAKKEYRIIPDDEAIEILWAHDNRSEIGRAISCGRHSAAQLREVARIIGWDPKP